MKETYIEGIASHDGSTSISTFHTLAVDGVLENQGEGARLHEPSPPAKSDVAGVVERVHDRALRWLRKHRYIDARPTEERSNEPALATPIEGLARLALA